MGLLSNRACLVKLSNVLAEVRQPEGIWKFRNQKEYREGQKQYYWYQVSGLGNSVRVGISYESLSLVG